MLLSAEQTENHGKYNLISYRRRQERISAHLRIKGIIQNVGWNYEECLALVKLLSDGMISFMYHHGLKSGTGWTSSFRKAINTSYDERCKAEAERILVEGK